MKNLKNYFLKSDAVLVIVLLILISLLTLIFSCHKERINPNTEFGFAVGYLEDSLNYIVVVTKNNKTISYESFINKTYSNTFEVNETDTIIVMVEAKTNLIISFNKIPNRKITNEVKKDDIWIGYLHKDNFKQ
jgi:hypothetical protein